MGLKLQQLDEVRWRIPREGKMNVDGLIYASERMMQDIRKDKSPEQVANVAQLPGILGHSIAMPDMHWGYGFPIGGVAAFDADEGVLSPGGVGYDINCGVRLLRSELTHEEVRDRLEELSLALHRAIPSGVGSKSHRKLSDKELTAVMLRGAEWAVSNGYGRKADLDCIEEGGCFSGADPAAVSDTARERGRPQLGSLGSGNHFCELGYVAEVYEPDAAAAFGLQEGAVTLMIHSGSRGFGYQICDDSLRMMLRASQDYGIELPDRQLCAAPLKSPEAKRYFGAMACAVNYAFANRQMMTDFARGAMAELLGRSDEDLGLELVYDVCHNIAKWETHSVGGVHKRVCVHRKGATRAFGPGHEAVPERYRQVGQPVLIPGDMGRYSFVMAGTSAAMEETFGSSCHGAGRLMSRHQAKKVAAGRNLYRELEQKGIYVRSERMATVAEEISEAYKDVAEVIEVVHAAGLARKVAKLVPMAVIKG
jgi:tRNA-splicing ligase RtcB (3'-phosphate/5'-hydroxy nucleic acid ligase)